MLSDYPPQSIVSGEVSLQPHTSKFVNLKCSEAFIFKLLLLEVSTRRQHFVRATRALEKSHVPGL